MIYFLEAGEAIKIGYTSNNPKDRISTLQTGNPYKISLLGVMKGNPDEERYLHKRFSNLRLEGEWFTKSDELMKFIGDYTGDLDQYEQGLMDVIPRDLDSWSYEELVEIQKRRVFNIELDSEIAASLGVSEFYLGKMLHRLWDWDK